MASTTITPVVDAPVYYHQKLAWKIREEDWNKGLISSSVLHQFRGMVMFTKNKLALVTKWPKDTDHEKIKIEVVFSIIIDAKSSVIVRCDRKEFGMLGDFKMLLISKLVEINPELLYDEDRCFTIEAEIQVGQKKTNEEDKVGLRFVQDMKLIFQDEKNSDLVVIAGNKTFHCHKAVLSARCEVFKNMLAHDTIESDTNTIEVKEAPVEAVECMLKYIYNGELPDDPTNVTVDLLNIAEKYLLESLKEACLDILLENLEVSKCISSFFIADRYMPSGGKLREQVIMFIKCKAEEVVGGEEWDELNVNFPALSKELMMAIVKGSKEKHRCQFCVVTYKK